MMADRNHATDGQTWECYTTVSNNLELLKRKIGDIIQDYVLGNSLKLEEGIKLFVNEKQRYILGSCNVQEQPQPLEEAYSKECWVPFFAEKQASNYTVYIVDLIQNNNSAITKEDLEKIFVDNFCTQAIHFVGLHEQPSNKSLSWTLRYIQTLISSTTDSIVLAPIDSNLQNCLLNDKLIIQYGLSRKVRAKDTAVKIFQALNRVLIFDKTYCLSEEQLINLTGILVSKNFIPRIPNEKDLRYEVINILCNIKSLADIAGKSLENVCKYFCDNKHKYNEIMCKYEMQLLNDGITPEVKQYLSLAISDRLEFLKASMQLIPSEKVAYDMLNDLVGHLVENKVEYLMSKKQQLEEKMSVKSRLAGVSENERKYMYYECVEIQQQLTKVRKELDYYLHKANVIESLDLNGLLLLLGEQSNHPHNCLHILNQQTVNMLIENSRREICAGTSLALIRIIVSLPKEMKMTLSVKHFLSHIPKTSVELIIKLGLDQKLVTEDIEVLCEIMYETLLNYEDPIIRSQAMDVLEMHKEQLTEEVTELLELERSPANMNGISGVLKRVERGRPVPQHYFDKLLPLGENSVKILEQITESNIQKLPEFIVGELKLYMSRCSDPSIVVRSLKLLLKLEILCWSGPEIRELLRNPNHTEQVLQHILNSLATTEIPEILLQEIKSLPKTNPVTNLLDKIQLNSVTNNIIAKLKNPNLADEDKKTVIKSIMDMKLSNTEKILEILENIIRYNDNLRAEAFQALVKIMPHEYEINKVLLYLDIRSFTKHVMVTLKAKSCNLIPLLNEIIKNLYCTNTGHAELCSLLEIITITELSFKQFCLLLHFAKYSNSKEVRSRIKSFIQETNYGKEETVDIIQYLEFLEGVCPQNDSELNTLHHCVEDGFGITEDLLCVLADALQSNIYPYQKRWIENVLFNISQQQHIPNSIFHSLLRVINAGNASNLSPEFIAFIANTCQAQLSKKALQSMFREESFIALCGIANYAKEKIMPSSVLYKVGELLISPSENIETRMLAAAILAYQEERNDNLPKLIALEPQRQFFKDLLCSKISEEYQILLDFFKDDDHSFHAKFYEFRGLLRNQAANAAVLWKCCINYCCSEISEEYKVLLGFLKDVHKSFHEKFYVLRDLTSNEAVNKAILNNFDENDWRKEFFSYSIFLEMLQRENKPHEFSVKEFRDNMNNLHTFLIKQNNDKTLNSEAVYEALLQKQRTFAFGLRDGINVLMMLQSNVASIHLLFSSSDNFIQKLKYSWLSHSLKMKKIEHTSKELEELCKYLVFKTTVLEHFLYKLREESSILQLTEFFQMLTESSIPLAKKQDFLMDGTSLLSANQWKEILAQFLAQNMLQRKLQNFKEHKNKSKLNLLEKTKKTLKAIKGYCWTTNTPLEQSAKGNKEQPEKILAYLFLSGWSEQSLDQLIPNLDTEDKLRAFLGVCIVIYDYELTIGTRNNKQETLLDILKNYSVDCWEEETYKMALYNTFKGTHIKTLPELIKEICELNTNTELEHINEGKLQSDFKAIVEKYNSGSAFSGDKIKCWDKDTIKDWAAEIRAAPQTADLFEKIAVINRAVEISCRFRPREIQLLAVLMLLQANEKKGCLAQVNTGEGKTVIIAMIAAIHCLNGHTVDVVTSSPELARPQSQEMQKFFSLLELTVAHNTEKNEKICYEANIVYGAASNFQGDILRDEYNKLGIRCGRSCDIAIVDEVDSMLIDNRNYKVMLSSPMPAMNHLEPVLALIWVQIDLAASALEEKNGLLLQNINKEEFIKKSAREFIRKVISEEETDCPKIKIPKHLMRLVSEVQLNRWIDCAVYAKYGCEQDKSYIIKDNKIVPVDASNTGVVQQNMHWNDGLHQFLQIKHGLRITPENLCTNFISNVAYFRRYRKIYGLTGTLGSTNAINLLKNVYDVSNVYLPPFNKEQHFELRPIIAMNEREHYKSIVVSSLNKLNNGRAVLIITKYIAEAKKLHSMFIDDFGYRKQKVKSYQTENDTTVIQENLRPGEVIIATNIAGRGTDIKLLRKVEQHGGLHVCVTFLPSNLRTERQNVGRTSRMGQKGTSQFIILNTQKTITEIREERDRKEEVALQNAHHEIERVCMHDEVFAKFCKLLEVVRDEDDSNNDIKMKALEERFALWFKLQHKYFEEGDTESIMQNLKFFESSIETEVNGGKLIENPYFHVQIGNRFLEDENYDNAIDHYTTAINMDPDFAETAHYNRGYVYIAKYGPNASTFIEELCNAVEDFKMAKEIIERHEQYLPILQLTHNEVTEQVNLKRKIYAIQKSAIDKAIGVENEMKDNFPSESENKENLHKGVIQLALEKKWNLQITYQKLQTVFKDPENIALYENNIALYEAEIKESENNGCIGTFEVKMIKPSINWWAFIGVTITGILQIIGGIVLYCLRMSALAGKFFADGVKDIWHAIEHVIIKRDFDWKHWGIKKAVSLVTGLVVFGCSTIQSTSNLLLSGLNATGDYVIGKTKQFWEKGFQKSAKAHSGQLNELIGGLIECNASRSVIATLQDAISSNLARSLEDFIANLLSDEYQEEYIRKIVGGLIRNEETEKYAKDIAAEIICNKNYLALSGSVCNSTKDLKCILEFVNYFISTLKIEVSSKGKAIEMQRPKENNHTPKQVSDEIAAQVSAHVTLLVEKYIFTECTNKRNAGGGVPLKENTVEDDEIMQDCEEAHDIEIKECLQKSTAEEMLICLSDIAKIPIKVVDEKGRWLHTVGKDKVGTVISITVNSLGTEATEHSVMPENKLKYLFSEAAKHSGIPENKLKYLIVKHMAVQNKCELKERLMLKLYKEELLQKIPEVETKSSKLSYMCREQYKQIAHRAFADTSLEKQSQMLEKASFKKVLVAGKTFHWHPDFMLCFKHTTDGAKQITEASAHVVALKNPINCKSKTCVLNIYPAEGAKTNLGHF